MFPKEREAAMCFLLSAAEISSDLLAEEGTQSWEGGGCRRSGERRGGEVSQDKKTITELKPEV